MSIIVAAEQWGIPPWIMEQHKPGKWVYRQAALARIRKAFREGHLDED